MRKSYIFRSLCLFGTALALVACNKPDDDKEEGGNYTLAASPRTVNFAWSNPDPQTVTVVTNSPDGFKLGATADWYSASVGADGKTVTLTAQSNDGDERTHVLVVTATGADNLEITVTQEAGGRVKEVTYNFCAPGPLDIGWPTVQFTGEFTDNITAGDGFGTFGGHFYAALDGVATQDKTLPVYKDIYGHGFDADGKVVDWLYNIGFTDVDGGPYTDGTGPQFKIYIAYKANTTGAPRSATIKLFFDETEAYKVVGIYDTDANLVNIAPDDPIFTCEVTQPAE